MKARWLIVGLSMVALATIDTSHAASKNRQQGARQGVRHAPASVRRVVDDTAEQVRTAGVPD